MKSIAIRSGMSWLVPSFWQLVRSAVPITSADIVPWVVVYRWLLIGHVVARRSRAMS
jgi:hypothetical protein